MNKITRNLKELGFHPNEIKVYLALTELGEAKASVVASRAGLSRTTTISILERLSQDNFVSTHRYKGTIYYWIESPTIIKEIYENKVKIATDLSTILSDIYRSDHNFPFAQVFDTKGKIKNFIEKILLQLKPNSTIYTIDSPHQGNYRKVLSDEYDQILVNLKKEKSIITKTLVPFGSFATIEPIKLKRQNIYIREMPAGIEFESSLWFIDDKMILFSGKPPFIVVVRHEPINLSMKNIFDFLWGISEFKEEKSE